MKYFKVIFPLMILLLTQIVLAIDVSPYVQVATVTPNNNVVQTPMQRKTYYAAGLYWLFYVSETKLLFRTSGDAVTWSAEQEARDLIYATIYGSYVDIAFKSDEFHIAMALPLAGDIQYRVATPNINGTLSWKTDDWNNIEIAEPIYTVSIALDGEGYPYFVTKRSVAGDLRMYRSSTKNGTWTTDLNVQVDSVTDQYHQITALTEKSMYIIWYNTTHLMGRDFNGYIFGAKEIIAYGSGSLPDPPPYIDSDRLWTATAINDDIYVAMSATPDESWTKIEIVFRKRDYTDGWQSWVNITNPIDYDSVARQPLVLTTHGNMKFFVVWCETVGQRRKIAYSSGTYSTWDITNSTLTTLYSGTLNYYEFNGYTDNEGKLLITFGVTSASLTIYALKIELYPTQYFSTEIAFGAVVAAALGSILVYLYRRKQKARTVTIP